ncbi:PorV/PorQ family protein [Gracilimonas tropica]|uniref:PorV/PorQ family protein n=1 Tax=Gracilimonas tropica TaxID=454600 RepID=UPI0003788907|nr:PorV/PorQ family protein [Gracilimonas tropica]
MKTQAMNMKKSLKYCLLLAGSLVLSLSAQAQDKVGTTGPAFLSITSGAKASAMGGAFVAVADDGSSMFWNPGGMAQLDKSTVTFSNMNWFLDSQIQDASVVLNGGEAGNFALSVRALNYGDIEVTTIENPEGTGEIFTPTDLSVAVSYSRFITDQFSIGANTKFVQQKIWNEAANGFAVDLGMFYRSNFKNLRIGMSITNFGTDMRMTGDDLRQAIDIDESKNGNNDRLEGYLGTDSWPMPLLFKVGLAIDAIDIDNHKVEVALDAKHPSDNSESIDVGLEYGFNDLIFLRGGYRSLFSSQMEDQGYTAGFGLKYEINGIAAELGVAYMTHEYLQDPLLWTLEIGF